jgi:chromosome segregation ATPase
MTYEILIGALGLIGALAVVVRPLIALNTNITALTASVNQLKEILEELKGRVSDHGKEIDEMRTELADHEARIKSLEKRG